MNHPQQFLVVLDRGGEELEQGSGGFQWRRGA